jgi:PRTRC genetic system protein B
MLLDPNDTYLKTEPEFAVDDLQVKPKFGVVVHGFGDSSITTYHGFDESEAMLPGKIVELSEVISALSEADESNSRSVNGWVSERVLFNSPKTLVWYKPKHKSVLWFRGNGKASSVAVTYPALVFVVDRTAKRMSVFACPSNSRPTPETRLYHAPVMNVYSNGSLCQGTAPLPADLDGCSEALLTACEDTLLSSYFTHVNHPNTFKHNKDVSTAAHMKMWNKLAAEGRAPKMSELVKTPNTLTSLTQG